MEGGPGRKTEAPKEEQHAGADNAALHLREGTQSLVTSPSLSPGASGQLRRQVGSVLQSSSWEAPGAG